MRLNFFGDIFGKKWKKAKTGAGAPRRGLAGQPQAGCESSGILGEAYVTGNLWNGSRGARGGDVGEQDVRRLVL